MKTHSESESSKYPRDISPYIRRQNVLRSKMAKLHTARVYTDSNIGTADIIPDYIHQSSNNAQLFDKPANKLRELNSKSEGSDTHKKKHKKTHKEKSESISKSSEKHKEEHTEKSDSTSESSEKHKKTHKKKHKKKHKKTHKEKSESSSENSDKHTEKSESTSESSDSHHKKSKDECSESSSDHSSRSEDEGRCDIGLDVTCLKLFAIPPSWKLRKCIQVCKAATVNSIIKTNKCTEVCPCSDSISPVVCCDKVKLCVFPGDKLEVEYAIFASKTSEGAIVYTANVILCNNNKRKIKIRLIKVIVEEKKRGVWSEIDGSVVKREVNIKIPSGSCVNATVAGSFPDSVGQHIRLKIKVLGPRCNQIIYEHIDGNVLADARLNNHIDKWCIKDDDLEGFPREISDSSTICTIPKVYPAVDCDNPVAICNIAQLEVCDSSPHDHCITQSNKTAISRKCANIELYGKSKLICKSNEQWCICKDSKRLEDNNNTKFIEYNVTATQYKSADECVLYWEFIFKIDCLSYPKDLSYTVTAGGTQTTDTFTLGPGKDLKIEFSGEVIDADSNASPPDVEICWNTDIYKLGTCKVIKNSSGECIKKNLRFTQKLCDSTVRLTDTLVSEPNNSARFADPRNPNPVKSKQFICDNTTISNTNIVTCNMAAARISKMLSQEGIDPTEDLDGKNYVTYSFLVYIEERNKRVYNTGTLVVKDCDTNILNEASSMVCDRNVKYNDVPEKQEVPSPRNINTELWTIK